MKIYYFSGTGNSLYAAKFIAQRVGGEYLPIENLHDLSDEIGLVFPVYCWNAPTYVVNILKRAKGVSRYFFAIADCGGSQGYALSNISKILAKKNITLNYGAELKTVDNSIVYSTSKEKIITNLAFEEEQLVAIADDIKKRKSNKITIKPLFKAFSKFTTFGMKILYRMNDKKIDAKKCINCKKCVSVCPVFNIFDKGGSLNFGNNCVTCFRCLHLCPTHAISFGKLKVDDNNAYLHPETDICELIGKDKKASCLTQ